MGFEDDFAEWLGFGRRDRASMFSKLLDDMAKMAEDMFSGIPEKIPGGAYRERRLSDGSIVRELGPFVYGYSMVRGPDGKTVVREFGNFKPSRRPFPARPERPGIGSELVTATPQPELNVEREREPLVDTIVEDGHVRVIAELPGVEKSEINLKCTGKKLTISTDTPKRKYYKEVMLPAEVDANSLTMSYKNGVLEVIAKRAKEEER